MNISLVSKLKFILRRLWEQWSSIQDQQDELWKSELGEESPVQESTDTVTPCQTREPEIGTPSGGAMDLGELINQRNAEHERAKPDGEHGK